MLKAVTKLGKKKLHRSPFKIDFKFLKIDQYITCKKPLLKPVKKQD